MVAVGPAVVAAAATCSDPDTDGGIGSTGRTAWEVRMAEAYSIDQIHTEMDTVEYTTLGDIRSGLSDWHDPFEDTGCYSGRHRKPFGRPTARRSFP